MAYSASDFATSIVNHFFDNGLLSAEAADSDDLKYQALAVIAVVNVITDRLDEKLAPETCAQMAKTLERQSRSELFMEELLEANETLTDIADSKGTRTLADCMYLLSAIQKGQGIEVHYPTRSEIVNIINQLPSAALWLTYVSEVTK